MTTFKNAVEWLLLDFLSDLVDFLGVIDFLFLVVFFFFSFDGRSEAAYSASSTHLEQLFLHCPFFFPLSKISWYSHTLTNGDVGGNNTEDEDDEVEEEETGEEEEEEEEDVEE